MPHAAATLAKFPTADSRTLDRFLRAYLECALWSSTDNSTDSGGSPLDQNYSFSDFSEAAIHRATVECWLFLERYSCFVEAAAENDSENGYSGPAGREFDYAAHDFWLTRNGHGAGFWDGGWGTYGDLLSKGAKSFGELSPYISDSGEVEFQ